MTTTLALGNGLLSEGRYAGYAPAAGLLPIKIGRGDGRIPEEDILRGLNWLLEDDRWQRYGVRVLNVSVGGDFAEGWEANPVCLAAEELTRRGVFIAAAAGNRGIEQLLAPAQAPSVLTVGGVDDLNRLWSPHAAAEVERLALYPHNWGRVRSAQRVWRKPELLALARWLPAPILPPTPIFQEMHAIARLRATLLAGDGHLDDLAAHWVQTLHSDPIYRRSHPEQSPDDWRGEMWAALRKRMNAHKWVHAYYQHVDGTSVAVAQVSAVAAQMVQANPALTPDQIKALLMQTAQPLRHLPRLRAGAGLLQPARAVAAALRAVGGPLAGLPFSGTQPQPLSALPTAVPTWGDGEHAVYTGLYAPAATHVSVIGPFNGWQPGRYALTRSATGWWHGVVCLPSERHAYRFWAEGGPFGAGDWLPDPEQPEHIESGYDAGHSVLDLTQRAAAYSETEP
jgi:serine protease AprX